VGFKLRRNIWDLRKPTRWRWKTEFYEKGNINSEIPQKKGESNASALPFPGYCVYKKSARGRWSAWTPTSAGKSVSQSVSRFFAASCHAQRKNRCLWRLHGDGKLRGAQHKEGDKPKWNCPLAGAQCVGYGSWPPQEPLHTRRMRYAPTPRKPH